MEVKTFTIKGEKYTVLDMIPIINGYHVFYYKGSKNLIYWNKFRLFDSDRAKYTIDKTNYNRTMWQELFEKIIFNDYLSDKNI
jgi:hypothetical protein